MCMYTRHTPSWKHEHRKDKAFPCLCLAYLDDGCEIKNQHIENKRSAGSFRCFRPFLYPSLGNKHCLLSSERVHWSPNPNPNLLTVNVWELCGFWKLWNFKKSNQNKSPFCVSQQNVDAKSLVRKTGRKWKHGPGSSIETLLWANLVKNAI